MSARDEVLGRLRTLGPSIPLPDRYAAWGAPDDPVGLFVARASAVGIDVIRPSGLQWSDAVVAVLKSRGARTVAVWEDPLLEPLPQNLGAAGIAMITPAEQTKSWLAQADAGITTAEYGIALSGTLVLSCDAQRPRSTSLLPPLHVAVLPQDRIVPTVGHVFTQLRPPLPPALTFITGPSRTADIELTVVKGVHGPVEVIVVLLS